MPTRDDDASKVAGISGVHPRVPSIAGAEPAEAGPSTESTAAVSPDQRLDAATALSGANPGGGIEALDPLARSEGVAPAGRLASVAATEGILATQADMAIADGLRSGALDASGALARIVDEVIAARFGGVASAELRSALTAALADDPAIAALLAGE